MAEDVHITAPGGNGERLELRVGSKAFGLSAKDLLPILLLLLVGVMAYYRTKTIDTDLQALGTRQEVIRSELREQNALVQAQTQELRTELHEQNVQSQAKWETLTRMLGIVNWNLSHDPGIQLPLDVSPPLKEERAR